MVSLEEWGGSACAGHERPFLPPRRRATGAASIRTSCCSCSCRKDAVVIELAPGFAPNTVANIKALVKAHYFDGSFIVRAQDNYVVQWARTDKRTLGAAKATIRAEFDRPIAAAAKFTALSDTDTTRTADGIYRRLSGRPRS